MRLNKKINIEYFELKISFLNKIFTNIVDHAWHQSLHAIGQTDHQSVNGSQAYYKRENFIHFLKEMASGMSNTPTTTDEDDLAHVEDIEQICSRISKYEPCFRTSLIQYHLKRLGISCNDERLVKLLSLSFETMVNKLF